MLLVFLISVFAVVYTYIGYLGLLWILSNFVGKEIVATEILSPRVSLLISVYNEEEVIAEKIRNSLAIDYPDKLFEIVVVSDGSTDNTNQIVKEFEQNGVILQYYQGRIGKTACLNQAVAGCSGEIVIFSDANSMYEQNAVQHLVRHFQEESIGLVSGRTKYLMETDNETTESTSLYTKLEVITKRFESQIGSCIGADGAIFAIRKKLYSPLAPYDINDFVIPLIIVEKGFRAILEEQAFCYEQTAEASKGEFNRQVRITNRTLRAIFNHYQLLNPFRYPIISFELVSHKLLKFLTPIFLTAIFFSSMFLMQQGMVFIIFFFLQLIAYVMVWLQHKAIFTLPNRLFTLFSSFILVNTAYLMGWLKYFSGETYSTWEPERKQE